MLTVPRNVYAPELRTSRDVSRWFRTLAEHGLSHHPDDSAFVSYRTADRFGLTPGRGIVGGWYESAPLLHLARHDRAMDRAHAICRARGWDIYRMVMRAEGI